MKRKFILILLIILGIGQLFSQEILKEFVIESDEGTQRFYKKQGCTSDDGVIVFSTTIPNLKFSIPAAPRRLKIIPSYDKTNSCYVLCIQPNDVEIGGYTRYSIDITSEGYKRATLVVTGVRAAEAQYFKINPKGKELQHNKNTPLNNAKTNIQNEKVTGKVVDKYGEALIGCSVSQKGTSNGTVSDLDGNFALTISRTTTLIFSYLGYKSEERIVFPGDNIKVTLKEYHSWFDWETIRGGIIINSKLNGEQNLSEIKQSGFQLGWVSLRTPFIPYTGLDITPVFEYRRIKDSNEKVLKTGFLNIPLDIRINHNLKIRLESWEYIGFPISIGPYVNFKLYGDKTININGTEWDINKYSVGINFKAGISAYNATIGIGYAWGLTNEFSLPNENKSLKGNYLYLNASYRFRF